MPSITAGQIVDAAQRFLVDETEHTWTREEMRAFASQGQRAVVSLQPSAHTKNEVVQLETGTRQSIPSGGIALADALRNMGSDGDTPGRAVRRVRREDLDLARPDWPLEEHADAEVKHWMWDNQDPRHFYVDPPQPSSDQGHLEIIYSAAPDELDDDDSVIGIDDIYEPALVDFVIAKALGKETGSQQLEKADLYYQRFIGMVTGRIESRRAWDPISEREKQTYEGSPRASG